MVMYLGGVLLLTVAQLTVIDLLLIIVDWGVIDCLLEFLVCLFLV